MPTKRQTEKNKMDRVFSKYIRLRDTDDNGFGPCITCGKVVHYKEADCGHFRSRVHMASRWHPLNSSLQCKACNMKPGGEQWLHGLALDAKHGPGTAEAMEDLSRTTLRLSEKEIVHMRKEYEQKVKLLEREKNI